MEALGAIDTHLWVLESIHDQAQPGNVVVARVIYIYIYGLIGLYPL